MDKHLNPFVLSEIVGSILVNGTGITWRKVGDAESQRLFVFQINTRLAGIGFLRHARWHLVIDGRTA